MGGAWGRRDVNEQKLNERDGQIERHTDGKRDLHRSLLRPMKVKEIFKLTACACTSKNNHMVFCVCYLL